MASVKYEAEMDKHIDIRVELPGQDQQNMVVWLADANDGEWTVSQEKDRLLKPTGLDSAGYQMTVRLDTLDPLQAAKPKTMIDEKNMMYYSKELLTGLIGFKAI